MDLFLAIVVAANLAPVLGETLPKHVKPLGQSVTLTFLSFVPEHPWQMMFLSLGQQFGNVENPR